MARIRSVHPGLSTDEAYMAMSAYAKAAWPTLWTECDDSGIFEWKPLVLKARLLPADAVDFETIMEEWVRLGVVRKLVIEGKSYGAVRNFCRFQRPKKPNYRDLLPDEFRTYVGLKPPEFGTGSELSPQMEREREKEEEREERTPVVESPPRAKTYAFAARHIRLNDDDFKRWTESFPHLELRAELESLDAWAGEQGKRWFKAVSGALAKRERLAADAARRSRDGPSQALDPRLA